MAEPTPEMFATLRRPRAAPLRSAESGRSRWARRLRILLSLLVLVAVSVVSAVLYVANRPALVEALVRRAIDDPGITLHFDDLIVHPDTGGLTLHGVRLAHTLPSTPEIDIAYLDVSLPWPTDGLHGLHIAHAAVTGLEIHAHRQRPPPDWTPTTPYLRGVTIDTIQVERATYAADRDGPLGAASVVGIDGQITGFDYRFGERALSGEAELTAARFRSGSLALTQLRLSVVAEASNVRWRDGRFALAGGHGRLTGRVDNLFRKPAVTLDGSVAGMELAKLVRTATEQPSPIAGKVDGTVHIETGGALRRGEARIQATVKVSEAHLPLDLAPSPLVRAALRLSPLVRVDRHDEVRLHDLTGDLSFSRGRVTLDKLVYASRREIRIDGQIDEKTGVDLMIRQARAPQAWPFVSRSRPKEDAAAYGFVVTGRAGTVTVRLATREELPWDAPVRPALATPGEAEAKEEAEAEAPRTGLPQLRVNLAAPGTGRPVLRVELGPGRTGRKKGGVEEGIQPIATEP